MLTFGAGHSVDYLTDAVAAGRESYYTGAVAAGEPPGRWYGRGAEALGLRGEVDNAVISNLYGKFLDPRDGTTVLGHAGRAYLTSEQRFEKLLTIEPDASPERREQLRLQADRGQQNAAFYDLQLGVQKSVTVLHAAFESQEHAGLRAGDTDAAAAWGGLREAVEEAVWAGNRAALDYLECHAGYTRVGKHTSHSGRWADAHAFTVASFLQHDSRDHDPQLHIHNAVLNRVQGPDGKWRTIDSESLKLHRPAASAMAERVMFEHLTATLGVQVAMRPDGKSREIVGVDQHVMDMFSKRTHAITPKVAALVGAFEARNGHAPNALQLSRFAQQATLATRRSKESEGETTEERLERWDRELRAELSGGLSAVAQSALSHVDQKRQADSFSPGAVMATALADVQGTKAAWTRPDLIRAMSDALPDYLGGLDATRTETLLHGLADAAIEAHCVTLTAEAPGASSVPQDLRLASGESSFSRPASILYATTDHVRIERSLRAAAIERGQVATSPELAAMHTRHLAELGTELGADQRRAVEGILTDGAQVSSLVGPAGTGKSTVLGCVNRAWADPDLWGGRRQRVIGLATSQIATNVLAGEGLTARNVASWLGAQQRLAAGGTHPDDQGWKLRPGDLIAVDESAMSNTQDLAAIRGYAQAGGAKLLLTGDHRQLAAVGAGGGMSMVAACGQTYELAEVRRFTAAWEREASLRLREGDCDTLSEYRKHGRIVDGGTLDQTGDRAVRGYLADTLAGLDTRLVVGTNELAADLSAKVRAELVRLGRVHDDGVALAQGTTAGVGDLVEARKLEWSLAGYDGNRRGPVTREQYRVLQVRPDGDLVVGHIIARGGDGEHHGDRLTLPASYVAEHLALGYASTAHSVQGVTVDTCHSVGTTGTGRAGAYVPLTRGRDYNTMYVATVEEASDVKGAHTAQEQRRDPISVLTRDDDSDPPDKAAVVEAESSAAAMADTRTPADRLADVAELATAGRTAAIADQLTAEGVLTGDQRMMLATDDGAVSLHTVLRQAEVAGHDPTMVLRAAVAQRDLGSARSIAAILADRISRGVDLDPKGDRHTDWVPVVADQAYQRHMLDLAEAADERRAELGEQTAREQPQWAVEALGRLPADPNERHKWLDRAGTVAAHRERTGHVDDAAALPAAPSRAQVELYASWRASWRALGQPEDRRVEHELSDGALLLRVRAMQRENTWAPPYTAKDLAGTIQAAQRHHQTAQITRAKAAAATDPEDKAQLARGASDAAALADALGARATQLDEADTIRSWWYAATAQTRAAASRATLELADRGVDTSAPSDRVTPQEWLAAHEAERGAEEPVREITRADVDERPADIAHTPSTSAVADRRPPLETASPDIREVTEQEPPARENHDDYNYTPSVDEVAESVERSQRALAELEARREAEEQQAADEAARAAELARRHAEDERVSEDARADQVADPVLAR